MFKVTRELINQRQPFCSIPISFVNVKNLGGGIENDCYGNAHRLKQKDNNFFMVSGWVVLPFNKNLNLVKVVQHWFNVDLRTKQHVDTSPVESGAEYVADMSLYKYCTENDAALRTHVAASLIFEDNKFKTVRQLNETEQIVNEVKNLTNETLYEFCKI